MTMLHTCMFQCVVLNIFMSHTHTHKYMNFDLFGIQYYWTINSDTNVKDFLNRLLCGVFKVKRQGHYTHINTLILFITVGIHCN